MVKETSGMRNPVLAHKHEEIDLVIRKAVHQEEKKPPVVAKREQKEKLEMPKDFQKTKEMLREELVRPLEKLLGKK